MNIAWCAFVTLLVAQEGAPPRPTTPQVAPQDPLARLAPRRAVAGVAGFQSTSTVVFEQDPATPHTLEATYIFPERARWYFAPVAAQAGERQIIYRCADLLFQLAPLESTSTAIVKAPDNDIYQQNCWALELRRALFLWPDGFAWEGVDGEALAVSECGVKFRAKLGLDGRPTALFLDGQENVRETYRDIVWREQGGRWWPATLDLFLEGQRVWKEHVEALKTQVNLLDLFFVPPDQRVKLPTSALQHVDMAASSRVRFALPEHADWNAAASAWSTAVARFTGPDAKGWPLAPGAWVELDLTGAPRAVLVGFTATANVAPPEGLVAIGEHSAVLLGASGSTVDFGAGLKALLAAVPPGTTAGVPYARFPGTPGPGGPTQIVVPLTGAK